ncbi:MAG TPA: winged helix-turn-helix domain-containing protein, partial [Pyrinomonadaceae bacterium]|nr:winged helix-turn-helix domain-containing protein [Pyrinomonadaceae bacterium]
MCDENKHLYKFGDFRLDSHEEVLYHLEKVVTLKPKAVLTLIVLVENAGKIVKKQDLMERVWQDTFVEENNLSVNIYELRKALLQFGAEEKIIETVSRR